MISIRELKISSGEWQLKLLLLSILLLCEGLIQSVCSQNIIDKPHVKNEIIEHGPFVLLPSVNPIIFPGNKGDWDGAAVEAGNVIKDGENYYFYFHGAPGDNDNWPRDGYRIGVASAPHPLGPWKKHDANPIIDLGQEGSWTGLHVACPAVIKEEGDKYYMWFGGMKEDSGEFGRWDIGLATASHPLGPWKLYEDNPVLEDFGFVGGVVKVKEKYLMYNVYPIGSKSPDSGPICLAVADKPEGPWVKYENNPVIHAGDWGAWDDGGFSEAGMLYHDNVFHCFYSGVKWEKLESIGYAYSFDGYNFIKYSANPVVPRENIPGISALAEIHAYYEPPFHYLYNTMRYLSDGEAEYLGVQILTNQQHFSLPLPVLEIKSLALGKTIPLSDSPPLNLGNITKASITVKCTYSEKAKKSIRIHVKSSPDNLNYDSVDLYMHDCDFEAGMTMQETFELKANVQFIKILVENMDNSESVSDIKITATLGAN